MKSRAKGARGERMWRDALRAHGFFARRGQQFSGSPDSPDVVCEALGFIHWEVKNVERLNIWDAFEQAKRDAAPWALPMVAYTRNHWPFCVAMHHETLFRILRHCDLEGLRREVAAEREQGTHRSALPPGSTAVPTMPSGEETISGVAGEAPDTARGPRAVPGNSNNNKQETANMENQS